ncbi:MAG: sulfatase [Acidobacteriota bacterium]
MASKARRRAGLLVAVLLLLLANWWSQQPPERFSAAKTVNLEVSRATPDSGKAYWISLRRIAPRLASDKESLSRIVLYEDGAKLTGRALHKHIRNRGGGLYSHWGSAILFSSLDGSDPRTNGRRYEVHLPATTPGWHRLAQGVLLVAALVLLIGWLHGAAGGSFVRTLWWAMAGAAGIATLAVGSALLSSPARELRTIRHVISGSTMPGADKIDATAGRPRTRHLLRGAVPAIFETDASPPAAPQPRVIPFVASEDAVRDRGYSELGDGAELRGIERLDVPAADLESVILEVESARDAWLILRLEGSIDSASVERVVEVAFTVSASSELQTVRFRRPALGGMDRVHHVAIRKNPATDEAPRVRVASLRYSLRLDAFTEAPWGSGSVELRDSLRPALWQSSPGRFAFPLQESDGSLLKLAVGALSESPAAPIDFSVSVVHPGGRHAMLHRGSVDPREGWHEVVLNLPEEGEQVLLLEGQHLAPRSALLWSGARLIDPVRPPRHMVLILADTLRADALGSYGHEGDPTPSLDALARQGVRFDRAFAQSYWTRPSMASMMTGRYVAATGVQTGRERLPESYETLAERLADGGFTTVGIVTNPNAGPHAGLEQGFDRIRSSSLEQTEPLIAEIVLPMLDELDDDDVFLYLHLMEAHGPYGPPEPPDIDLQSLATGSPLTPDPAFDRPWSRRPTAAQRVALYKYDVRSMDRALGKLFAHLDRRWRSPAGAPPIVAFVSDHGEHLGERDQWGHRWADLYPENVQVPLIIRAPGRLPPQTEFSDPVEIRHLGGTLLDLAGLKPFAADSDPVATWRSLLPLLEATAEATPQSFAVSAAEEQEMAAFSLFGPQQGYVARIVRGTPRIATFSDSGLDRRMTAYWPRLMLERSFLRLRRTYLESQGELREQLRAGLEDSDQSIDPEALESLRALGYLQE